MLLLTNSQTIKFEHIEASADQQLYAYFVQTVDLANYDYNIIFFIPRLLFLYFFVRICLDNHISSFIQSYRPSNFI